MEKVTCWREFLKLSQECSIDCATAQSDSNQPMVRMRKILFVRAAAEPERVSEDGEEGRDDLVPVIWGWCGREATVQAALADFN